MLIAVKKESQKTFLETYFNALSSRGYVNRDVVKRMVIWMFAICFVRKISDKLTTEDLNTINKFLECILSKDYCFLPYSSNDPRFEDTGGTEHPVIAVGMFRKSENGILRITESNIQRIV